MKSLIGFGLLFTALAAIPFANANDRPPVGGKSLGDVIGIIEGKGYGPITEVSFDDGVWEVETYKSDVAYEVTLDPASGDVISAHRDDGDAKPPTDSMPLAKIVAALEKAGYQQLSELSFERKIWEIEAMRDNQKRELRVDPRDGRVLSDRVDD